MCDFLSVVVRVDGATSHVPRNSHSEAVKKAGWTETDSQHKASRFCEAEWSGEGEYPGADAICRNQGQPLTAKQVKSVDRIYKALALALKGDLDALTFFKEQPEYSDVIDRVIWDANADPKLVVKFMCDAVALKKEIAELSVANSAKNASSGDSAKNASSGDSATNASSGDSATNASSGHYATNASSGDSATNASSGHYAKNASSGDSAKNASSGHSAKNEGTGKQAVCSAAGLNSTAKVGAEGCFSLAWFDGKRPRILVGYAGENGIKADVWYKVENGKLVEA